MEKTKYVFLIRINYKTGIQEEFWVTNFSVSGGKWEWTPYMDSKKPILLYIENIESVWQIDTKKVLEKY